MDRASGQHAHYRHNSPPVIQETVDGEAIMVNLDTGSYYDLNHAGADVWNSIASGATVAGIIEGMVSHYGAAADEVERDVGRLLAELVDEELIVAAAEPATDPGTMAALSNGGPRAYEAPKLNKYTDMQELLLLDPVHDVDDTGWPNRP